MDELKEYVKDKKTCIGCLAENDYPGDCEYCNNLLSKVELIEKLNTQTPALPNPCTVEQWEEIKGEKFVGLVWARYSPGGPSEKKWSYWEPEDYPDVLNDPIDKQIVIVQTAKPAPEQVK